MLSDRIPRLRLTAEERQRAISRLRTYLEDRGSIVKAFAMQGLADLARDDEKLRIEAIEEIRSHALMGTPAMKARGRRLLRELER